MNALILHDRFFDPVAGRISAYFCQLFVLIGENYIRYVLLDTERNSFIGLAAYSIASSPAEQLNAYSHIGQALEEDETLQKKYPSVIVGLDTPWHSLSPTALFREEKTGEVLRMNYRGIPTEARFGSDRIGEEKAVNMFAFAPGLEESLRKNFPDATVVHCTSGLLKSWSHQGRAHPSGACAYVNLRGTKAEFACFEKGRLLYFNAFQVRGKEDVLFFTLYALEQLDIPAREVSLVVSGEIEQGNEMHHLLGEYLERLELADRPGSFEYSPLIRQLPAHRYHDLFSLALCGS